jgi:hypothetical protein
MRRWLLVFLLSLSLFGVTGAGAQGDGTDFIVRVRVESAFARAVPAFDAEASASVFEGEPLEAISRNLDGTWFEVRRPGRLNALGWVYEGTVDWTLFPELLPLGDVTTGSTGPSPLLQAPLFAFHVVEGARLRTQPTRSAPQVQPVVAVPPAATVPVLARNQDGSWLFINYLGYQGWVVAFAGREIANVLDIPQAQNLPPLEGVPTIIIPVELQQAQIDRLRVFIYERRDYAVRLEQFWWRVFRGEVMPCDAPPEFTVYPYTSADVQQLPELERYIPRLGEAIAAMQSARQPLLTCGIVSPSVVADARDFAINARIIFDATLGRLQDLQDNVVQIRR